MQRITYIMFLLLFVGGTVSCGRGASRLLRQGQLPIYDFPLYLTDGVSGQLLKFERDGVQEVVSSGLSDPRGVATDRFGNVYVAEFGAGRVLKFPPDSSDFEVVAEDLLSPSIVAVDSFGEVFVTQDGGNNIIRIADSSEFASFASTPSALVFGVNDVPIIGLFDENKVSWGIEGSSPSATVTSPSGISIDGTGRVYVSEGSQTGQVFRYHQQEAGEQTLVANAIIGPLGIAVDPVGNIFVVEQGAGRIVMISYDQVKFAWVSSLSDPQYLAFTQY